MKRRTLLASLPSGGAMLAGGASTTAAEGASGRTAPPLKRLIATEEAFHIPETGSATQAWFAKNPGGEMGHRALFASLGMDNTRRWFSEMLDFGAVREAAMDSAGITTQLLLIGGPVLQLIDPPEATRLAALTNDRMAELARREPRRYAPLAALATQEPAAAARELERAIRTLKLHGAVINSHTKNEYLDDPKYWPILEAAQALDVPIYLHPREPSVPMVDTFVPHDLIGPIWGFAAETGLHALRMIMAGVFDRFPKLQIVLGHLGESLPFFADRFDIRYRADIARKSPLKRLPSDYLKSNFHVTTSGMNWGPALRNALEVMGHDRVMFAADWPFEDATDAAQRFRAIELPADVRDRIAYQNAERIFRIAPL